MSDRVVTSINDGVADVRLNRPEKLNALDMAMFSALVETSEALKSDPSVRAVVLSGEGRGFCAGLDFASFQDPKAGTKALVTVAEGRITHGGQQTVWGWRELEVPVIAAIEGPALGGGCQLALGADFRYIHPEAQMSVLEIRWGLIPDMCGTVLLPPLVGPDIAKELTWTGRMVSGTEAVELGLASRLSDTPRDDALALAAAIATNNPAAVKAAKGLIDTSQSLPVADAFANERSRIHELIGSPNQLEAVTAFFEDRDPAFED